MGKFEFLLVLVRLGAEGHFLRFVRLKEKNKLLRSVHYVNCLC